MSRLRLSCLRLVLSGLALALSPEAIAQRDGLLQIGDQVSEFLLRQQTLGRLGGLALLSQPLSAYDAQRALDSLALRAGDLSAVDRVLLARFRGERPGPGAQAVRGWAGLYRNGQDLLSVAGEGYAFQLNPAAYLTAGRARQTASETRPGTTTTWQNTRAVRASGHVGPVFFESRIEETQARPVRPQIENSTAPRERVVRFLPLETGSRVEGTYDFGRAMGVVGFRSRHFEARFGRDRNRWGAGTGSLWLSDFAPVYDQLQLRTTVWRLQYTNLFAAMDAQSVFPDRDRALPRKYGAFHKLALSVTDRLQIELFESVIFLPDTLSGRSAYDVSFLNPVIFYHQVEKDYNFRGNLSVGAGAAWTVRPGVRPYGQVLLTEFQARELFSSRRAWSNKWGFLLGLALADLPVENLDVRAEVARVRPYTYSHHTDGNYTHYNDPLGFAAGQNLWDAALFLRYRPHPQVRLALSGAYTRRGRDTEAQNFGGDPRRSYDEDRPRDFGVRLLQGVRRDELLLEVEGGYELLPGLFLAASLRFESISDEETGLYRYVAPSALVRWGLPFRSVRY
ncbi:MAG: capsule assembly Wzi family protein [Bacteroidota bacterium]